MKRLISFGLLFITAAAAQADGGGNEVIDVGQGVVIRNATVVNNGAQFLQREATMGRVEDGKEADLVLLSANPFESASNLSRIAGVFLNGKYFSAHALEAMKSDVAKAFSRQKVSALHTAIDPDHKH